MTPKFGLILLMFASAGAAATPPHKATPPDKATPRDGPAAATEPVQEVTTLAEGEQLLARARVAYADAKSYRDEVRLTYAVRSRDDGVFPSSENVSHVRFALRDPQAYRYERWAGDDPRRSAGGATTGDTLDVWVGEWGQCITVEAQNPRDPDELGAHSWGTIVFDHPLAPSLLRLDRPDILAGLEQVESVRIEIVEGRPCLRLGGVWNGRSLMVTDPAPGAIWIDRATMEVRRFEADVSQLFLESMLDSPGLATAFEEATLIAEFTRAELNPELGDDVFAFDPPEGMRRMSRFDLAQATPPAEPEAPAGIEPRPSRQVALVGQTAPEFSGNAIDGAPFALSDLRGQVVVLDFWATWCGPCIAAMPSMRDLANRYADKGVVVVGVSLDAPDAKAKIQEVVAAERLPYRQFHDALGAVSSAYDVSGIPCVVVIDAQGIVRAVHVGFGPGAGARLEADVEKLLGATAGKP